MSTTQHNATRDIALTGASLTGLSSPLDGLAGTLQAAFAVLRRWLHPSSLGRSLQSALRLEVLLPPPPPPQVLPLRPGSRPHGLSRGSPYFSARGTEQQQSQTYPRQQQQAGSPGLSAALRSRGLSAAARTRAVPRQPARMVLRFADLDRSSTCSLPSVGLHRPASRESRLAVPAAVGAHGRHRGSCTGAVCHVQMPADAQDRPWD